MTRPAGGMHPRILLLLLGLRWKKRLLLRRRLLLLLLLLRTALRMRTLPCKRETARSAMASRTSW